MDTSVTSEDAGNSPEEGVQVCARCARLVHEKDYYCPHCGAAVNAITPYLPFINIQFYAVFCGDLWRVARSPESSQMKQLAAYMTLLLCTPVIWLVLAAKVLGLALQCLRYPLRRLTTKS